MAHAAGDAHDLLIYGAHGLVTFPILDADGDLVTAATGLDSEVSKDLGTMADCTNEATEIATGSGTYYLYLTGAELTANVVTVIVKTTSSGAKTTVLTLYPKRLPVFESGTAQAGAATTITLASGASAVDNFYNGMFVYISNNGAAGSQYQARKVLSYVGSTRVATVESAWGTNPSSSSTYDILMPETVRPAGNATYSLVNNAGTTTLTGAVSLGSTLGVTGATTLTGLTTGALSATTITASGAVAFQSTLGVTGATTFTGNVAMAAGLNITQSSADTSALVVTGNGTGNGILATSGSGATGSGIYCVSAATFGAGIECGGSGSGAGLYAKGGIQGNGFYIVGGTTSGHGIVATAGTSGMGIYAVGIGTSKNGIYATGDGNGSGIAGTGGSTGYGALFTAGISGGDGIRVVSNTANGMSVAGGTNGLALTGVAGDGLMVDRMTVTGAVTATNASNDIRGVSLASVTVVAAAVWNATRSTYVAADSFGQSLQLPRSGTAQSGVSDTIILDTGASAVDDFYQNCAVQIIGGTGAGQVNLIESYAGVSKIASLRTAWPTELDATSVYAILPTGVDLGYLDVSVASRQVSAGGSVSEVTGDDIELTIGVDYKNANGNAVTFAPVPSAWTDLTGATVTLTLQTNNGAAVAIVGTVDVAAGTSQSLRFDVPAATTGVAVSSIGRYFVWATLASGDIYPLSSGNIQWKNQLEA